MEQPLHGFQHQADSMLLCLYSVASSCMSMEGISTGISMMARPLNFPNRLPAWERASFLRGICRGSGDPSNKREEKLAFKLASPSCQSVQLILTGLGFSFRPTRVAWSLLCSRHMDFVDRISGRARHFDYNAVFKFTDLYVPTVAHCVQPSLDFVQILTTCSPAAVLLLSSSTYRR